VSRIKARCSDAGLRITREAIQIHGAIGFTDEYDAGLYLKRALVLSAWLGNAAQHRRRYAQLSLATEA
jgi:alkylation response protein AidB-like acyl-CoA dehydrogenase